MQSNRRVLNKATGALACLLLVSGTPFAGGVRSLVAQGSQNSDGVRLRTARFWRVQGGRTLVEGLIGLPLMAQSGSAATLPVVEFVVRDSTGKVLHTETWTDSVSDRVAALASTRPGAEVTRTLSLQLERGRYSMSARVTRGTRVDSVQTDVVGFASQPLISDVLVSSRIRALKDGEEPTGAETRKGRYAIERATLPKVLPTEPNLWYYLELYPLGTGAGTEELEFAVVRAAGGDPVFRTQRTITVGERGGSDAARLVVQGLPPGDYRLIVTAKAAGREERREGSFTMGSLADAPVVATASATGSESALHDKYFAPSVRSDVVIGQIVDALVLVPVGEGVSSGTKQLPAEAQRRYLARYWSRISDPVPGTEQHELVEEYLNRVMSVSRDYVEKDIGRTGARTDRGRVFLKYGLPDAKQVMPMSAGKAVEVWKYTRQRNLKFAFLDETGFQNYNLVYTTDPNEQTVADWQDRVRDADTIRLILSF